MTFLFNKIEKAIEMVGHGWLSPIQAFSMASIILGLRPSISVEIGVYAGKGLISLALAHMEVRHGIAIGIDPYSPHASADGQLNPADKKFWSELNHEQIYRLAIDNIGRFGVQPYTELWRMRSDEAEPPKDIGLLRIDGNHGEQVLRDIDRFCPNVRSGGIVFLDDLNWTGGSVSRGAEKLKATGWKNLYSIENTLVFQKP